jgi:hypothetical protein
MRRETVFVIIPYGRSLKYTSREIRNQFPHHSALSPFSSEADRFIFFSATAAKTEDLLAAALECGSMMPQWGRRGIASKGIWLS